MLVQVAEKFRGSIGFGPGCIQARTLPLSPWFNSASHLSALIFSMVADGCSYCGFAPSQVQRQWERVSLSFSSSDKSPESHSGFGHLWPGECNIRNALGLSHVLQFEPITGSLCLCCLPSSHMLGLALYPDPITVNWIVLCFDWLRYGPMTVSRAVSCSDWLRPQSGAPPLNQSTLSKPALIGTDLCHALLPVTGSHRPKVQ